VSYHVCDGCRALQQRLDRFELILMQDPGFRDRAKLNAMAEQVVSVAKAEGQLLPPIDREAPPL
jgi:hypothetical protein